MEEKAYILIARTVYGDVSAIDGLHAMEPDLSVLTHRLHATGEGTPIAISAHTREQCVDWLSNRGWLVGDHDEQDEWSVTFVFPETRSYGRETAADRAAVALSHSQVMRRAVFGVEGQSIRVVFPSEDLFAELDVLEECSYMAMARQLGSCCGEEASLMESMEWSNAAAELAHHFVNASKSNRRLIENHVRSLGIEPARNNLNELSDAMNALSDAVDARDTMLRPSRDRANRMLFMLLLFLSAGSFGQLVWDVLSDFKVNPWFCLGGVIAVLATALAFGFIEKRKAGPS